MSLNPEQTRLLKDKIEKKLKQNPALIRELGLKNITELNTMPAQQLEERLNPKLLGVFGLSKKDIGVM